MVKVLSDPVSVSIAGRPPTVDVCELCSTGPEALRAAVLVRHARGGTLQFAVCERCTAAMRRLIAAVGGAASTSGPAHFSVGPEVTFPTVNPENVVSDAVGEPVLVREVNEPLVTEDGRTFAARIFGQERRDGTWIGWLTFVGADGQTVLLTGRETTHSNRQHLENWATRLPPS